MINKSFSKRRILARGIAALFVGGSMLTGSAPSAIAADAAWTGATSGAWLTTTNWSPAAAPGSSVLNSTNTDIATFSAAANPTIGINLNTTVGIYALGALDNTNATARTINNSSTTVPGILTLNGATVNAIANTILRNTATTLFTVTNGTSPGTMGVRLGNTSNVVQITGTGGVTIGSNITEATAGSGLTLQGGGAGALTLSGANVFTGATTIDTGSLLLGNLTALGGSNPGVNGTSGISMATGTTLRSTISGVTLTAPITTTGSVTIGAPSNNAGQVFSELVLNGVISGAGTTNVNFSTFLNANTIQTVTLGAANTYAGNTTIGEAITGTSTASQMFVKLGVHDALPTTTVLSIEGGTGAGTGRGTGLNLFGFNQTLAGLTNVAAAARVQEVVNSDISAPATLTINGATNTTFSGNLGRNSPGFSVSASAIPGSTNGNNFGLTKNGSGTFTISGVNTYSGTTRILGGILSLGNASAMSQSPLDTTSSIAGDATNGLQTTVTTLTLGGLTGNKNLADVFTTTAGGYTGVTALTLNPVTGATLSYSGNIAEGAVGMTLTKSGAGTQTLSGANSFTGATAINAGALILSGANTSTGATSVNAGTLTLDYSSQDNSKLSDTGALTLGAATLALSGGTHTEIVASTTLTAGTASTVTRSTGAAVLQMGAITNGALASIDFGASGIATTDTLNNAYGILGTWATIAGTDFASNSTNAANGLITAPTYTDVTRLNGGIQVIADGASTNVRIVEGTGSAANITLGAAATTIATLTQSASGGSSAATIDSAGQTLLTNAILVGTGAGSLTVGNGTLTAATAGGELALASNSANNLIISSIIANNTSASTLSKFGTGTVALTNANTYTGTTTISAGTLQLGAGGTTGSLDVNSAIIVANSGNFAINRSNAVIQGTDFSGAAISGTGSFTQAGTGTTTLNAVNTYSGSTTISAGTLNANSSTALGNESATNSLIFNGGTLQAAGTITSPATRGVTMTGNGTIDTNGNAVSFAGVISGTGGLTKNGAGILTSSAFNTLTGPLTINGGELVFSANATGTLYASTQININNGAILRITGTTGNQNIYEGRNYTFDSVGGGSILVSTGNYNAATTPFSITTNGGAQNTIGLITTSGAFGFNIGATVATFNVALGSDAASDLTVTPIIANTGSILKTGSGRLTLTGANTFSGGTTINAGTLRASGGAALTGLVTLADVAGATLQIVTTEGINGLLGGGAIGGTVSIDAGQTFSLASGTQTYAGTIVGAGTLTNSGAAQTLNGALSHTGGVNVTGGTLTLGSSSNSYTNSTVISSARGLIVTANGALGAIGTGNETTVTGTGGGLVSGVLGFSGGINYSTAEKITGSGIGNTAALTGIAVTSRGFIQSVSGSNTFAGAIELSANGNSRIGTQDGAQLTLTGPITQATGVTTANILFRVGNNAGDFVTLSNAGNSFGGDSTVFTGLNTAGSYAGVRLGINNALPTNLTISSFSGTGAASTALDLAGFNQSLNGLITGVGLGNLNIINQNTITPSTLTLNPTADKATTNTLILGGGALGVINVVKSGTFTQTLGGDNTHTGTTTVSAGKLLLNGNNTAATGAVGVSALATLGGSGTVGGLTTVASTGIVAPGNSAGNLTFAAGANLSAGGVYNWELGALSVINPGTDFDTITVSGGNLALGGTSALTLDFNLVSATDPNSADVFWTTGKSWKIVDVTTGTNTGDTNLSTITNATYTSGTFATNVGTGGDAGDIFLVFTPGVAGPSIWQGPTGSNWTTVASWTGSVPNSATAEAQFTTLGGATSTANLDTDQSVNKLTFDATTGNDYTISGASKLTLTGTTPSISTTVGNTGDHTVATNVELGAGTTITVNAGSLTLNVPTTNAVLGAGVTATVAVGATLNLGGAGNALSNGTLIHADVTNNGTLAATTAGKRVGHITGTGTTNVNTAGASLTASSIRQGSLNIGAANTVTVAPNGSNTGVSQVTNLSINATGKLDLKDNDLIVDNGNLAALTALVNSGLDIYGIFGNGPGITSTTAGANPSGTTALGIAANSELGYTTFGAGGLAVDANDVLIKYTYFGDADLSGTVDNSVDFDLYVTGLTSGGSLGGWLYGDFDYNGTVDNSTDFDLYITGVTGQGGSLLTAGFGGSGSLTVAPVPEPGSLALIAAGVCGAGALLRRRRRQISNSK